MPKNTASFQKQVFLICCRMQSRTDDVFFLKHVLTTVKKLTYININIL